MRAAGLVGCHRRRRARTTVADPAPAPAPNLVARDFAAPAPDRAWIAEIVCTQMTKALLLAAGARRDDVADLYLAIRDDDAVDEELDELALLLKRGRVQSSLRPAAEIGNRGCQCRDLGMALGLRP